MTKNTLLSNFQQFPTEQYPHISRSQMFYKKGEKLSFRKDQINTPTLESLFNKVTDL